MAQQSKPLPLWHITLDDRQANVMLDALQRELNAAGGDERRTTIILAIESLLSSGLTHSKER